MSFFFFSPRFIFKNATIATPMSVHLFPWDPKHTDPQTRSSQRVRNSCHFQVFRPQISEPDMTRLSFRQLSLFIIWRPGFLETSIEFISCVCWGNTEDLSSLKEVKQACDTKACCVTSVLTWKIFGISKTCPEYKVFYDKAGIIQLH